MLEKFEKTITVRGSSYVENTAVVGMVADITTDNTGNTSVVHTIYDKNTYNLNLEECRKDIAEFQTKAWEIEDQLISEMPIVEEDATMEAGDNAEEITEDTPIEEIPEFDPELSEESDAPINTSDDVVVESEEG